MLAVPLSVHVLQTLEEEPTPLAELHRSVGLPPVTTLRSYLRKLTELGVIERRRENDFPGSVSYALTPSGKRLLAVADVLREWLRTAPDGPIQLGSLASRSAIKALVDGWSTGIVRALAAKPLALTELNRLIPRLSYPSLERRLTGMRQVGLVEPDPKRNGRVARCRVTPWLRLAVAPFTAAVGWERSCIPDQAPVPSRLDAEAAFLLAVPLLQLSSGLNGTCRMAVEFRSRSGLEFAGVTVAIVDGEIQSCVTRIGEEPDAWATGSVLDWFRWLRDAEEHGIEIGGDAELSQELRRGLGSALMPLVGR